MTARTKRLFSASQPAGNWEAFFGYLITATKEVMGLVWFGCTKKKGICMNIFYQRCSRSGSGSRNFWKDSSPWWNWVQRCTDLAVSLQSHVRLKRKKQLVDFDLMFSRKYDFWIQGICLHVAQRECCLLLIVDFCLLIAILYLSGKAPNCT